MLCALPSHADVTTHPFPTQPTAHTMHETELRASFGYTQGSNAGKFRDGAPMVPYAGKITTNPNDSVTTCMQVKNERPPTPDNVAPYRKSRQAVGKSVTLKGKAHDPPPPDIRFGRRNSYNDAALTLIQADTCGLFQRRQQELKESVYATNNAEPLGRTRIVANMPEKAKDPDTRFGRVTKTSENSKSVIYPFHDEGEDEEAASHEQYCRTHNSYDAGEQKKRGYNWTDRGIDPVSHTFGFVKHVEAEGVKQAMVYGRDVKTAIVKKTVEDFKDVSRDELGKPKNQGFANERNLPPNYTYGKKNTDEEWGVKECMALNRVTQEEAVDKNLGKSLKPGFRNDTEGSRTYGVPSVRSDIPKPRNKKVTDSVNYGDDSSAINLICPSKYVTTNVHESVCDTARTRHATTLLQDFLEPVDKEFMRGASQQCGFDLEDDEFEQV